jgi:hypothetical protein
MPKNSHIEHTIEPTEKIQISSENSRQQNSAKLPKSQHRARMAILRLKTAGSIYNLTYCFSFLFLGLRVLFFIPELQEGIS